MDRFVTGLEPGREGIDALIDAAQTLKAAPRPGGPGPLAGRSVAALFLNPSLRTRASLEAAVVQLGGHLIPLSSGSGIWSLEFRDGAVMDGGAEEHVEDAVGALCRYADALAVRAYPDLVDWQRDREDLAVRAVARYATVPVVNLESAMYHPCQGLADLMTWREVLGRDLRGRRLSLVWTWHPKALPMAVPDSVVLMASLAGMDVTVAHPDGYDLDAEVLATAERQAGEAGGRVRVTRDRDAALSGAEVVYARSWGGVPWYGKGNEEYRHKARLSHWRIDGMDMAKTADATLMHPLPVRRNVEVEDAVLRSPRSAVLRQAENRLHVQKALLARMLGG
ncbi:N-acetylornithine carbamoyltransferase [Myxococcota bacterium]|nr:N-acetylornithine carbamoyltransferase [Myxococcota bacterium]